MPDPLRDTPAAAIELIKSFEGLPDGDPGTANLDAYLDPLGIWTIGWGHAVICEGRQLKGAGNRATARRLYPGGITIAQAEALLRADLLDRSAGVLRLVKVALDDGQFGALMSFAFNCGVGNLAASTLLRLLNAGRHAAAADQFLVWNKGRNRSGVLVELPGLTRRRRAERAMFLGRGWRAASAPVTRGAAPAARGRLPGVEVPAAVCAPLPERPVVPTAAAQRAAAVASGVSARLAASGRKAAKRAPEQAAESASKTASKTVPRTAAKTLKPRARTTTATGRRPAARAGRPPPRTAR